MRVEVFLYFSFFFGGGGNIVRKTCVWWQIDQLKQIILEILLWNFQNDNVSNKSEQFLRSIAHFLSESFRHSSQAWYWHNFWLYSTGHFIMDFSFFYKNSRLNQFVQLSIIFFQYTDTKVRFEHWKTLNSSIFS